MTAKHLQIVSVGLGWIVACYVTASCAGTVDAKRHVQGEGGRRVEGIAPRVISLHDLLAPCTQNPLAPGDVLVSTPLVTIVMTADRLPAKMRLRFSDQGSWSLRGEPLDLRGTVVDAPEDHVVLPGSPDLFGLSMARPE